MSRNKIKVYCYQHKELIAVAESLKEAAQLADTSSTMVRRVMNLKIPCTRDGWVFTDDELTEEELKNCPDSYKEKNQLTRYGNKCKKEVRNQAYEVDCKSGKIGYIPRNKAERKALLRQIVYARLEKRWTREIPEKMATLERSVISELIDTL